MNLSNLLAELKRRRVNTVAAAYLVVSCLLIQVATQVFPLFDIPNWVVRAVVLLTIVGFPIAVVSAWAFELAPEGIKREEEVDHRITRTDRAPADRSDCHDCRSGRGRDGRSILAFATNKPGGQATSIQRSHRKQVDRRPALSKPECGRANAYFAEGI